MKSTFLMEMNPTGVFKHIPYVNIPDLDAGRIPYPMSEKGRYAVGERKTVLFLLSDSFSTMELNQTLQSLLDVLRNPINRVFIDILVIDWDNSNRRDTIQSWKEQFERIEDCSFFSIQVAISNKNTHFTLIENAFQFIDQSHYEQIFFVPVFTLLLYFYLIDTCRVWN